MPVGPDSRPNELLMVKLLALAIVSWLLYGW